MGAIRTIVVAEDDDDDFFLVRRALKQSGYRGAIVRAINGEEVIRLLRSSGGAESEVALPAIALLDLKMPLRDGFDVLEWKDKHRELPCVPVIIFSSSEVERDVKRAYKLGAHAYVRKPARFEQYVSFFDSLRDWWSHCELADS